MNLPYSEHKILYIAGCIVLAVSYAMAANPLSVASCVADAALYAAMLFGVGCALWYIFRYAFPQSGFYTLLFLSMLAVLTAALIVGLESALMYLCFPDLFGHFASTIPVRLFINLLLFATARLSYLVYCTEESAKQPVPTETPISQREYTERFTVRSGQKIKVIPIEEIIYIQAEGDYIDINTLEGHWLKEQTMKTTEEQLPHDRFIRVHRSYIVNISQISRIERYGEQQQLTLRNGEKIRISATGYKALRSRLRL
jgi:hypothetical protein